MSLQAKLDAFKADFETNKAPASAVAIMHRDTEALIASGQADRALKAGDTAPAFELADADGVLVRSADLLAHGPLVLTFYRGVWCPYCNLDLAALQETAAAIRARGASMATVSPQTPANSRKARDTHHIDFPLLSDRHNALAEAFGLKFRLSDELIDVYKGFGVNLPATNDDPDWTLPMPARFVIGTDGVIVYAEVNPDYTRRPDPSDLIPVLDRLRDHVAA